MRAVLANFQWLHFNAWFWIYIVARAVHTWTITLWTSMAHDTIGDQDDKWLALIGSLMYLAAMPPVLGLASVPPRSMARISGPTACVLLLMMGGGLAFASSARNYQHLGISMVLYVTTAESLLALSVAQLARSIRCERGSPVYATHYLGGMLMRFIAANIVADLIRLVIMPTWYTLRNPFGIDLSLSNQFLCFIACLMLAMPAAILMWRFPERK